MSDNVYQMDNRRRGSNDGGDDGGNMLKDLEKRVEKLENHIGEIKTELMKLTVRSENFVTKADLIELNSSYKADTQALRTEMHQAFAGIHKEISSQTKWIAATMISLTAICLTAAKFLF